MAANSARWRGWLGAILTAGMLAAAAGGAGAAELACSAERPAAASGESVRLRAWTDAAAADGYHWEVEAGAIEGDGREVVWRLAGVRQSPVPYSAQVRLALPDGDDLICRLALLVTAPSPAAGPPGAGGGESADMRGGLEAGRLLLPPEREEAAGYGLYSYLLFGAQPGTEERERYLAAIAAYLGMLPDLGALERYLRPAELNVVHLPVSRPLPAGQAAAADWLLAHYDYARARAWLAKVPGQRRQGPYLVSTLQPLGAATAPSGPFLIQDLSRVPPQLAGVWVREFLNQAAQERFWEPRTAARLTLRLRTVIAQVAIALPEVRNAMERLGLPDIPTAIAGWITWSDPP